MAVQHIVLVKWSEDTAEGIRTEAREMTRRLATVIPGISAVAEGPSVGSEGLESGFTWGFVMTMESAEALENYLPHPEHRVLADLIGTNSDSVTVFDIAD